MYFCKICGDLVDFPKTHMLEEHREEFSNWLREHRFDEFVAWAEGLYWESFVDRMLRDPVFRDWVEEHTIEVEPVGGD